MRCSRLPVEVSSFRKGSARSGGCKSIDISTDTWLFQRIPVVVELTGQSCMTLYIFSYNISVIISVIATYASDFIENVTGTACAYLLSLQVCY